MIPGFICQIEIKREVIKSKIKEERPEGNLEK
jgi:hypothetical protein